MLCDSLICLCHNNNKKYDLLSALMYTALKGKELDKSLKNYRQNIIKTRAFT